MASTATKGVIAIIVFAVASWWAHDKLRDLRAARSQEKHSAEQKQQSRDAALAASRRYGAIVDWDQKFTNSISALFSLGLQDAIMPEGGKPIVIDGRVDDVERQEGRYFLHVVDRKVRRAYLRFVLECDAATARKWIEKKRLFIKISVVGQIASVEKAQFAIKSGVGTMEDPEPVEIDSSRLFIAHGRCIEIISTDN
jgi:hypothetical protein